MRRLVPWLLAIGVLGAVGAAVAVWWAGADAAASCADDAGPAAIVGVSTDGAVQWSRLAGHAEEMTAAGGVVAVRGREIDATLRADSGATITCLDLDLDPRPVVEVAASTSLGPHDPPEPTFVERDVNDRWRVLVATPSGDLRGQRMHVAIESVEGERLWDAVLPGFVVTLAGDQLLVIDQTDGTGDFDMGHRLPTRLTVYEIGDGEVRWHATVPGTPHLAIGAGNLVVIPGLSELHGFDAETGEERWQAELGNPGRTRHYSEPGNVTELVYDDATDTIVAAIRAAAVYRD